ncbi:MAG: hypothetical protein ACI4XW_14160 [Candidatus Spyradocola sp.]
MAGYDKSKSTDYTLAVQSALKTLGADLGAAGVDGKWGDYTERAYQAHKGEVDALVTGMFGGGNALTAVQIDVPEQRSFSEWMSVGDALYAAQAEAQRQSAQRQLEYSQQQVERNRIQSAATLENAANARGFGRSSYATDMLQRNEYNAQQNQTALLTSFSDALERIAAERASSAAQYASNMWKSQQDAVLSAQKFNAQMQQEVNLKNWQQAQQMQQSALDTYTAALERSRRSSSSGSKKKQETAQAIGKGAASGGVSALMMGMDQTRRVSGMK